MAESKEGNKTGLAAALVLLVKLGGKILPTLAKLGKVLLSGKVLLFAASAGVYAVLLSWKFAVLIMLALVVHEYGHVWAMKRCGMRVKGMYFIPFLGAAAVTEEAFPSRSAESYIAFMGPIWGGLLALAAYGAFLLTGNPLFAAAAGWMAFVNVFNLLPINPLDGGRILKSIAASLSGPLGVWIMVLGLLLAIGLASSYGLGLLVFIGIIGLMELSAELRGLRYTRVGQAFIAEYAAKHGTAHDLKSVFDDISRRCAGATKADVRQVQDELRLMNAFCSLRPRLYLFKRLFGKEWLPNHINEVLSLVPLVTAGISTAELEENSRIAKVMSSQKLPMTGAWAAASFAGYLLLGADLLAIMFACAHIPGADIAVQFLR